MEKPGLRLSRNGYGQTYEKLVGDLICFPVKGGVLLGVGEGHMLGALLKVLEPWGPAGGPAGSALGVHGKGLC